MARPLLLLLAFFLPPRPGRWSRWHKAASDPTGPIRLYDAESSGERRAREAADRRREQREIGCALAALLGVLAACAGAVYWLVRAIG